MPSCWTADPPEVFLSASVVLHQHSRGEGEDISCPTVGPVTNIFRFRQNTDFKHLNVFFKQKETCTGGRSLEHWDNLETTSLSPVCVPNFLAVLFHAI